MHAYSAAKRQTQLRSPTSGSCSLRRKRSSSILRNLTVRKQKATGACRRTATLICWSSFQRRPGDVALLQIENARPQPQSARAGCSAAVSLPHDGRTARGLGLVHVVRRAPGPTAGRLVNSRKRQQWPAAGSHRHWPHASVRGVPRPARTDGGSLISSRRAAPTGRERRAAGAVARNSRPPCGRL